MKRVNLVDLTEMSDLSWVLDQALYLLANSPAQFRASDLSKVADIPPSHLTRMRLAHANASYESGICYRVLLNLLKYLFECFPMLSVAHDSKGQLMVRLNKTYRGKKLESMLPLPPPKVVLLKRTPPKPGSTRWYLAQMN